MIKALKTDIAILGVLFSALGAQIPHAKEVFVMLELAPRDAVWHGYAYAFSLEGAVLIFVVNGCKAEAYFFAGVSILINLCYYALTGHSLWQWSAAPFWIISLALPIVIARYSHLVAKHGGQDVAVHFDWRAWVQRARAWVQRDGVHAATPLQVDTAPIAQPVSDSVQVDVQDDVPAQSEDLKIAHARMLKSEGLSNEQIGQQLGVHRNTIGKWLKLPIEKR